MDCDVIVAGGGIAGLSCALRLMHNGVSTVVLEAEKEAGGNVRSRMVDGFLLEWGPHTFMGSADDVFTLAEETGMENELVSTRECASNRFIVRDHELHPVFTSAGSFLKSRLLSFKGKMALITEPFRSSRSDPDDTAQEFFNRRFGKEAAEMLAGAFISGVYAGDPAMLSARAAFPLFWNFEQNSGSMIRGAVGHMRKRRREWKGKGISPRKGLFSFRYGLGHLTNTMARIIGERCMTSTAVRSVSRQNGIYRVLTEKGQFSAPNLVIAVPPRETGRLLRDIAADISELVSTIPMAPLAVVYLGYKSHLDEVPDGFGFLAPRKQGVRSLGILFPSRLFDGRAPGNGDLLTGFVGGMMDWDALNLDDEGVVSIVQDDLDRLLNLTTEPSFRMIRRHPHAIPQFVQGHVERMEKIRTVLASVDGLYLAGNYMHGVGMKDAVASGFEAAEALSTKLTRKDG